MKTYQRIASLLEAIKDAKRTGNAEWVHASSELARIMRETAPSGSGFDDGTVLEASSDATRLVFSTSFYHTDAVGHYDGWTKHQVMVTPSLAHGYNLLVTGRDRNGIKEYIATIFDSWLNAECKE